MTPSRTAFHFLILCGLFPSASCDKPFVCQGGAALWPYQRLNTVCCFTAGITTLFRCPARYSDRTTPTDPEIPISNGR